MIDHNFQPLGTTQDKVAHLLALVFFPLVSWSTCLNLLDWHDGLGRSGIIPCVLIASIVALIAINMIRGFMSFNLHAALSDEGIQIKSGDQIQTYSFSDTQTVLKKTLVVFKSQSPAQASSSRLQASRWQHSSKVTHPSAGLERRSSSSLWDLSSPSLPLRWLYFCFDWHEGYSGGASVLGRITHWPVYKNQPRQKRAATCRNQLT